MGTTGYRHASPSQRHRHHRRMIITYTIASLRLCRDVPNRSQPTSVRAANDVDVVVVVLTLGEQKHRLVRFRRSIPNRLRMRVRLVPYDLGTNPPTRVLKRESESPRQSDQILGFETLRSHRPHRHGTSPILSIRRSIATIPRCIRVTDVEPNGSVVGEYAAELCEYLHDACQIFVQRVVASNLSIYFVIPKRPVRRRRDDRLDAPFGEQFHGLARAPTQQNRLVQFHDGIRILGLDPHIGAACGSPGGDFGDGWSVAHGLPPHSLDARKLIGFRASY